MLDCLSLSCFFSNTYGMIAGQLGRAEKLEALVRRLFQFIITELIKSCLQTDKESLDLFATEIQRRLWVKWVKSLEEMKRRR